MKKIVVGSANPTKIAAAKEAFEAVWPEEQFEAHGVAVDSGVSDQPMTFEETIRGAKNRARAAMLLKQADFAVGIEGGLEKMPEGWFESGWCAVLDSQGNFSVGSSPVIPMPDSVMKEILQGKELGIVIDEMTSRTDVRKQEGFFGLMTRGALGRSPAMRDGVIFALARFARPEFFAKEPEPTKTKN